MKKSDIDCHIFMFINSGSGSGIGQQLCKINGPLEFLLQISKNHSSKTLNKYEQKVQVYFYNLRTNREQGFNKLKLLIDQNKKCLGVICGGDGTVTWVISELDKYKIPTKKVPFSIIPLGTGNDFSQSLGWGATTTDLFTNQNYKLKKFLKKMLVAEEQDMDVWQVIASTYQYGKIQKYQGSQHKNIGTQIEKCFVNYFSFGLDGKVGYSFDKHRTTSRIGNLMVYGALGIVKGMTTTKKVNQLVDSFKQQQTAFQKGKINFVANDEAFLYSSNQNSTSNSYIYENNKNILALNINSFMGGTKDIWSKSTSHDKSTANPQSSSDGKLQFVSFPGSLQIGMQKAFGGFSHRIHQGSGPFYFQFKQYDKNQKHRTYLQIDGQFYRFTHPKRIIIRKSALLDSKFSVLKNKQVKKQKQALCC